MKRFIILSSTIRNMGGAQMYAANKLEYYERLGWKPDIYYYDIGPIRIEYLRQFESNYVPELKKHLRRCNKKEINKALGIILGNNYSEDDILIECHMPPLALWGELIADRSNGKNTVFLIEENLPRFTNAELSFYVFKFSRKEMLNSGENGLKRILQKKYDAIKYSDYNYSIKPYCSNVVDYTPIQLPEDVRNAEYSILSIGRLDKPYIKPMLKEILIFTEKHSDKRFNLIIIGGDLRNEMAEYIKNMFSCHKNVQLYLLGYIFPIPYDWISISDVAIAMSNSVLVSANEGIPSINLDIQDMEPIGVYGYTTENLWRRKDEEKKNIVLWLEEILIKRTFVKTGVKHDRYEELAKNLAPHLELLNMSSNTKEYFDVLHMYSYVDKFVFFLKRLILPVYLKLNKIKK